MQHSAVLDDIALSLGNFNENENSSIQSSAIFGSLIVILVSGQQQWRKIAFTMGQITYCEEV